MHIPAECVCERLRNDARTRNLFAKFVLSALARARAIVVTKDQSGDEKLFRVRFRQRNRSLPKYVTPTSSRPNISLTEPDFVIEGVLISGAFDLQQRSNNSRIAPYSHFLRAFLLLLVLVDRPFFSRFLDQVGFRQRSTAVCYQNKVIGQNPIHYCDVIGLNCRLVHSI